MKLTFKLLIAVIMGIIAGALLFGKCNCGRTQQPVTITKPEQREKVVQAIEKSFKHEFDSVKMRCDSFELLSKKYYGKYLKANEAATIQARVIENMLDSSHGSINDYEEGQVRDYIKKVETSDAYCHDVINSQTEELKMKEVMLQAQAEFNYKLRNQFDSAVNDTKVVLKENESVKKQLGKQKTGKTFWKAVAIAALIKIGIDVIKTIK